VHIDYVTFDRRMYRSVVFIIDTFDLSGLVDRGCGTFRLRLHCNVIYVARCASAVDASSDNESNDRRKWRPDANIRDNEIAAEMIYKG
jgi:hypothetical protein